MQAGIAYQKDSIVNAWDKKYAQLEDLVGHLSCEELGASKSLMKQYERATENITWMLLRQTGLEAHLKEGLHSFGHVHAASGLQAKRLSSTGLPEESSLDWALVAPNQRRGWGNTTVRFSDPVLVNDLTRY